MKIPSVEGVFVAHIATLAGVDIRIQLGLRPAVGIYAAREYALCAGTAVRTAAYSSKLNIDSTVRPCRACCRQSGISSYVSADGVELSPVQVIEGKERHRRRGGRRRKRPWLDVELVEVDRLCLSGQGMADSRLEDAGQDQERGCRWQAQQKVGRGHLETTVVLCYVVLIVLWSRSRGSI